MGKRTPAEDDDQDKTLVLERGDPDYPLPQPPAEDPTRVHPVAAPPEAVRAAVETPTEALRRTDALHHSAPAADPAQPPRPQRSQGPRRSQRPQRTARAAARPRSRSRSTPALFIAGVLAGVVALAIVIATSAGGGASSTAATVKTGANVRSAPTTNSQVVGSLSAGQHITIACTTRTSDGQTWDRLAQPQAGRYVASWLVAPAGKVPSC